MCEWLKYFRVPENGGCSSTQSFSKSKFPQEKKIHRGLGKMSRHFFFSVFVIIKSSDGIRSRRKGRGDEGVGGG